MREDVGPNTGVFTHEQEEYSPREFWALKLFIEHIFIASDDQYVLKCAAYEIIEQNTGTGGLSHHAGAFFDFDAAQSPGDHDRSQHSSGRYCARASFGDRYFLKPVMLEEYCGNTSVDRLFDHDADDAAREDQHDGRRSS